MKIGTELVQPIGRVTNRSELKGDWNVVRLWDASERPCLL